MLLSDCFLLLEDLGADSDSVKKEEADTSTASKVSFFVIGMGALKSDVWL